MSTLIIRDQLLQGSCDNPVCTFLTITTLIALKIVTTIYIDSTNDWTSNIIGISLYPDYRHNTKCSLANAP
mgnify:CR=1 FL=1